jgi:pyrroloquinoline quinone biosynthesis protein E
MAINTPWKRALHLFGGYAGAWARNRLGRVGPLGRVTISLTDRCNSRCVTCFIWRNEGTEFDLDARVLRNLVDSRLYRGAKEVMLTGGEIFLRDDLVDIVKELRVNRKMYLTLATNGLLTERVEGQVREMQRRNLRPDRAAISLDGRPETHARIRGVEDGFDRAVASARRLRDLGLDITLIFTITRQNVGDMLWSRDFAASEGFAINYYPEIESPRFEKPSPAPPFDESQKAQILANLRAIYGRRGHFYLDDSNYLYTERYFRGEKVTDCDAGRQNIYVNWDGRVYPCEALPGSERHLGSLKDSSLDAIWRSSRAGGVRDYVRSDSCQLCYMSCDLIPALRKKAPSMLWHTARIRLQWAREGIRLPCKRSAFHGVFRRAD